MLPESNILALSCVDVAQWDINRLSFVVGIVGKCLHFYVLKAVSYYPDIFTTQNAVTVLLILLPCLN